MGMLARINRLTADRDFDRLFKSGKNFSGRGLSVKVGANGLGVTRFAIVVGTKVSKDAVDRNLLKRRLREIVRRELPAVAASADVAIIARPEALKLSFQELQVNTDQILRRAGVLAR